jgi:hypothetical protein
VISGKSYPALSGQVGPESGEVNHGITLRMGSMMIIFLIVTCSKDQT